jgi:hypothetical protein
MAQYTVGTVTATNGSAAITGVGTKWAANIANDWIFKILGEDEFYEIQSITDDTHLVISPVYAGTTQSGLSYVIVRDYTYHFQWPIITRGNVDWTKILSECLTRIDNDFYETPTGKGIKSITFAPLTSAPTVENVVLYFNDTANEFRYNIDGSWRVIQSTAL